MGIHWNAQNNICKCLVAPLFWFLSLPQEGTEKALGRLQVLKYKFTKLLDINTKKFTEEAFAAGEEVDSIARLDDLENAIAIEDRVR